MIATIMPQNWKNTSQVMYIGITSLAAEEGKRKKDSHFLGMEEVNRHRVALLRASCDTDIIISHSAAFVKKFYIMTTGDFV